MQTLDKLKKKHEYLTPEIAEQAGVSRSLFYKFMVNYQIKCKVTE